MSNLKIKIGADPELVLRSVKTGQFVSAHDLLLGTKEEPYKVNSGAVQVDGVAAEFNIDPAESKTGFLNNISSVMKTLQEMVGKDYELVSQPAVTFPESYFKSLPEKTRELGCNPDFNAWTGQVNEKPDGESTTMRTFSGHIHIGWCDNTDPTDSTHFQDCCEVAKQFDYYLGLYSLQWDQDKDRRKLYGKAGSFRPKPYGMEYRPLSNVWLRTKSLQEWVYNAANKAFYDIVNGNARLSEEFGELAREFIDNSESWWTPEDAAKSKDHKRLYLLHRYTGLMNPPPLPKPEELKQVLKASPKYIHSVSPRKRVKKKAPDEYSVKLTGFGESQVILVYDFIDGQNS